MYARTHAQTHTHTRTCLHAQTGIRIAHELTTQKITLQYNANTEKDEHKIKSNCDQRLPNTECFV